MDISAADLVAQYRRAKREWPFITDVNNAHGLPPALLYALGSRETNLQNEIGDYGHGHGVFQLDDRSHKIPPGFDGNVHAQAETAAEMMMNGYKLFSNWVEACNYYNSGHPETGGTTHGDYGPDVMERQAYLAPFEAPPASVANRTTAATNHDGRLEVFEVGSDRTLHHKWQTAPNAGWSSWADLGGKQLAGGAAAATNADGRLETFVIGGDGALYHKRQNAPGKGWTDWTALGGSQLHGGVAAPATPTDDSKSSSSAATAPCITNGRTPPTADGATGPASAASNSPAP